MVRRSAEGMPVVRRRRLSQILPELASEEVPHASEGWARQRLFNALDALLTALREQRPLAFLVEDAHWADATTLDLLELLGTHSFPLVVTVRTEDPDVHDAFDDWLTRARRLPGAARLALVPLTLAETTQQLALLRGRDPESDEVARIHARSLGQPLFTEQLALHPDDGPLPELLADLLLHRLRGLSPDGWLLGRALGVADRPLQVGQLAEIMALDPIAGLRDLDAQRLLAPADGPEVRLRHPLMADAIRHHMVAGEAPEVHRRVAMVLAAARIPGRRDSGALGRGRGQKGGAPLADRGRAGSVRTLCGRVGRRPVAARPRPLAGRPRRGRRPTDYPGCDVRRNHRRDEPAGLRRRHAAGRQGAGGRGGCRSEDAAAVLLRVGEFRVWQGEHDAARELGERAVAVYADLPPCHDHVFALRLLREALERVGRFREAAEVSARAVTEARRLGIPSVLKLALAWRAWHQAMGGGLRGAQATVDELTAIVLDPPDPYCEIDVAVFLTYTQLMSGAPADDLLDVARTALIAADTWGLHQWYDALLRSNLAEALIAQGDPDRAWDLVAPYSEGDPEQERWPLHEPRAVLELIRGHAEEAQRHITAAAEGPRPRGGLVFRLEHNARAATIELWRGQPADALDRALPVLESGVETDEPVMLGALLVLAARAAADLRDRPRGDQIRALHRRLTGDPFAPHPLFVTPAAHGGTWAAELARLQGRETVDGWVAAAAAWDRLTRPYDAAYCRWRGAHVALATVQGTLAGRLLKRAARDARGHIPLSEAIRRTAEHGPDPEKPALAVPHGLTP